MNYIPLLKKMFVIACLFCIGKSLNAQTIPPVDQLKPGESFTIIYDVTVNAGTPSGTILSSTSTVTANNANTASSNTVNLNVVTCPQPTITPSGPTAFCLGGNVTLTALPGDPNDPAQSGYNWYKDGVLFASTQTVTVTQQGNYTVEITNTCAGVITSTVTAVMVNPLPTATISATSPICIGGTASLTFQTTGASTVTVTYTDGTSTFNVGVTGGIATVTAAPATTTTYSLISATDANTCSQAQSGLATVTVNPLSTAVIGGVTTVCSGSLVFLDFSVTGAGIITVTYNVSAVGNFTKTFATAGIYTGTVVDTPITPGNYSYTIVSVTDANGCTNTGSGTGNLTVNALPTATIAGTVTACIGGSAVLNFTATTSAGPVTITYTNSAGQSGTVSNPTGGSFTATVVAPLTASATTYTITSVTDGNSCVNNNNTGGGVATVTGVTCLSATVSGNQAICFGGPATLTFSVTGNGTVTVTYADSQGGVFTTTGTQAGSPFNVTQNGLSAGTHTFTIVSEQDQNLTLAGGTSSATVIVNPLPTATISGNSTVCAGTATQIVTFTGSNGTAPYTFSYKINNGPTQTVTSVGGSTATVTQSTVAGTYTYTLVSVQDASTTACSQAQTGTVTIKVNTLPTATIAGNATVCTGAAPQQVTFTGANGTSPYTFTYSVTNGTTSSTLTTSSSAGSNTATVVQPTTPAGTYTYTLISVQDANTCSQAQTGTVTIQVNPLPTATFAGTISQTICSGSAATFTATLTGTGNYTVTYQYSNGASTIATTMTVTGNTLTITVPPPIAAGTYTFTITNITDGNGCSNTGANTATLTINQLPTATINGMSVVSGTLGAGDGVLSSSVSQNLPSITCGSSKAFPGTFPGASYYDTYTYKNTTSSAQCVTVSFQRTAGASWVEVVAYLNNLDPSNLATNYLGDRGLASTGLVNTFSFTLPANNSVVLLVAENSGHTGASYTMSVSGLPALPAVTQVCQFSAPAPQVTFTGTAGTPPYTFSYSVTNGTTTTNTTVTTTSGSTVTVTQSTAIAGTYTYTLTSVTDGNGCTQAQTGTVTIRVISQITGILGSVNVTCNGGNNGSINVVSTTGGLPPITFSMDGVNYISQPPSGPTFPNLIAGIYNIYARDALGCTWPLGTSTITQPTAITYTVAQGSPITCNSGGTTSLTITATGGTGTYTYKLDGGTAQPGNVFTTGIGTHNITVTDAAGCTSSTSVTVNGTSTVVFNSVTPTNNTCFNGISGQIAVRATGAGTITYTLTAPGGAQTTQSAPSGTTVNFTGLAAGSYTITATDNTNCPAATTAIVSQPSVIMAPDNSNGAPDLLLTSVINPPTATFTAGSTVTITYTISLKNNSNISAQGVIIRITKPFSGYQITVSGTAWVKITDNTTFAEFQLKAGLEIPCSGSMTASISITRAGLDSQSPGLPITATVRMPGANPDNHDQDNARASQFRVQ